MSYKKSNVNNAVPTPSIEGVKWLIAAADQ